MNVHVGLYGSKSLGICDTQDDSESSQVNIHVNFYGSKFLGSCGGWTDGEVSPAILRHGRSLGMYGRAVFRSPSEVDQMIQESGDVHVQDTA